MNKEERRIQYLSEFLKDNQTVKEVDLSDNQIGDEAMRSLAEAVSINHTVEVLVLSHNQIGDEGMQYLSEGIKVNQTVKTLVLVDNAIGDEGVHHLIEAIRVNTALVAVDVFYNISITDSDRTLMAALADMPARVAAREDFLSNGASRMIKSAAKR